MHGLQGNHGPCNVGQQDNGEIRGIERKRERKRESSRTFYNGSSHSGSEYLRVYVTVHARYAQPRRVRIKLIPCKIFQQIFRIRRS